jgi:hypothetical protein
VRVVVVHALGTEERTLLAQLVRTTVQLELGPETRATLERLAEQLTRGATGPLADAGLEHQPTEDDMIARADLLAAVQVGATELLAAAEARGDILSQPDALRQAREMLMHASPEYRSILEEVDRASPS